MFGSVPIGVLTKLLCPVVGSWLYGYMCTLFCMNGKMANLGKDRGDREKWGAKGGLVGGGPPY